MFTIVCNGITTHIKCDITPFAMPIHCVAHRVDLAMKLTPSTQLIVDNIEEFLIGVNFYFFQYNNRALELERLDSLLDVKDLKIFQNVKTRWFSMLSLMKRMLVSPQLCIYGHIKMHVMLLMPTSLHCLMFGCYLASIVLCFCLNCCMGLSKWFKLETFMLWILLKL